MASLIGGGGRTNSKQKPILALRIQSSINGTPIPIVYGQTRVPGTGIWTDGFKGKKSSSGKGAAAGKGGSETYTANIAFGICEGPVSGIFDVWENATPYPLSGSKGLNLTAFAGTPGQTPWGYLSASYPAAALNYSLLAYAGANPFSLGSSPSMPNLTWEVRGAISNAVTEVTTIGSPYTFTPTYFNLSNASIETATIPPLSPYVYQATNYMASGSVPVIINNYTTLIGTISQGVVDANGNVYTRVGSAPGAGQYSVSSTGLYTFNAANANTPIYVINFAAVPGAQYVYQPTGNVTNGSNQVTSLSSGAGVAQGTLVTGANIPIGTFVQSISGTTVTLSENATGTAAAETLTFWGARLNQVLSAPGAGQFTVSVQNGSYGTYTFSSADNGQKIGIVDVADANAADVVIDFLTNPQYGCGFPASAIGSLSELRNSTGASGLFVSPAVVSGQSASDFLTSLSKALNGEFVWSGAQLTWKSYGDVPLTGYGYSFTPSVTPIYSFTDDDFMPNTGTVLVGSSSFGSADPLVSAIKSEAKIVNDIKVSFLDRGNSYNPGTAEAQDDASINFIGLQPGDQQQFDFFCMEQAAALSAQLLLGREQVSRQFGFTVPWYYCLADPMDPAAITEAATGLAGTPVRVIEITENQQDGSLSFLVEELLAGSGTPGVFSKQASGGYNPNSSVPAPAVNTPIIFARPFALSQGALQIGIIASGTGNWGGCDVYYSTDNATYVLGGQINGECTQGVLTASFALGTDPDTTHTLAVDLTESQGALVSGSTSDADQGNTLCIINNEFIAYSTATPTSTYGYSMGSYIRRGMFGSVPAAHSNGALFGRVDGSVYYQNITNIQLGATIYIKLVSFNQYGGGFQNLSDATVYTISLAGPPVSYSPTNLAVTPTIKGEQLTWQNPTNTGVAATQVWRSATSSFSAATHIGDEGGQGTLYVDTAVQSNTTYWYWIRTKDAAGSFGPYYPATSGAGISATTGQVQSGDIGSGAVGPGAIGTGAISAISQFTNNITPVEFWSGATLPTTGNYNGRTLIWANDGKLYRYVSGAWTKVVDGNDIAAGTVGSVSLGLGSVTGSKLNTGDSSNLFPDPTGVDIACYSSSTPFSLLATTQNYAAVAGINVTNVSGGFTVTTESWPVEAGKPYFFSIITRELSSGTATPSCSVQWINQAGTIVATNLVASGDMGATTRQTQQINAPSNAATANFIYQGTTSTTGASYFIEPIVRRATNSDLLTVGAVTLGAIANGAVNVATFASGLTPIEIVSTLPTTGNYDGRTVFLTTNKKIYRYSAAAGAFISAVDGGDITAGSLGLPAFAVGLTPVENQASLPTTGNYQGRTVYIASLDKIYRWTSASVTTGTTYWSAVVQGADILAGSIQAVSVAAQAITASKVYIGDTSNMTPDPQMVDYPASWVASAPSGVTVTATTSQTSANKFTIAGSSNTDTIYSAPVPVEAGVSYYFSCYANGSAGNTSQFNVRWYSDTAASVLISSVVIASTTLGAITQLTNILAAPSTAVCARISFVKPSSNTSAVAFASPIMRRAVDGSLVVAGSINANALIANSITAGQIQAGAISTAQLAADAVTASRVFIGDTSNMIPDPTMADFGVYPPPAITYPYAVSSGAQGSWSSNNGFSVTGPVGNTTSANTFKINASSTNDVVRTAAIPVEPSTNYYVTCMVDGTSGNLTALLMQWFSDTAATVQIGSNITIDSTTSGAVKMIGTTTTTPFAITSPSTAVSCKILVNKPSSNTSAVSFWSPVMRRSADGSLIVDGSITAGKLSANSVSANSIQANAVTAAALNIGPVGLTVSGLNFKPNSIAGGTASANKCSWTAGSIAYLDTTTNPGTPQTTTATISAGNTATWTAGAIYIYFAPSVSTTVLQSTTSATTAFASGNIVLAWYAGGINIDATYGRSYIDGGSINTGSIAAGTLAAGSVTTNNILAGSITASLLYIGDSSNMIPDPLMVDYGGVSPVVTTGQVASWFNSAGFTVTAITGQTSLNQFTIAGSSSSDNIFSDLIPVEQGVAYYFGALVTSAGTTVNLNVRWYSNNTGSTVISTNTVAATVAASSATQLSGQATSPSNAVCCRLMINKPAANTNATSFFTPVMRRASDGTLITPNSITSNMLQANSIIAGKIAAGAIRASSLYIGDSSNMLPDPIMADFGGGTSPVAVASGTFGSWTSNRGYTATATTGQTSLYTFTIAASSTSDTITSAAIPVESGVYYYFGALMNNGATQTVNLNVLWYSDNAATTLILTVLVQAKTSNAAGTQLGGLAQSPSNAVCCKWQIQKPSGSTSSVVVYTPVVRRGSDGTLITPGGINASNMIVNNLIVTGHITANAISVIVERVLGSNVTSTIASAGTGGVEYFPAQYPTASSFTYSPITTGSKLRCTVEISYQAMPNSAGAIAWYMQFFAVIGGALTQIGTDILVAQTSSSSPFGGVLNWDFFTSTGTAGTSVQYYIGIYCSAVGTTKPTWECYSSTHVLFEELQR